ncbi:MAG TPA: flagellar FliJ family protein [Acidimicrobiales bacterium]|nr:flagellar FliJ family protein [Acidimicrobiales bacterium]
MATRYEFRLAGVLRLRRAEYDQAAIALERSNALLRSLIAERDAATARCRALGSAPTGHTREDFLAGRQATEHAAAGQLAAAARVNVAAAEAALARITWAGAHRNVAALERLDERRREEWSLESARLERLELDELATVAFVREHAEGSVA